MKTFKFFSKKQTRVPLPTRFVFSALDPIYRNIYLQGYYDALDCYNHGYDINVPYHPIEQENEYALWNEGVRRFRETNNIS